MHTPRSPGSRAISPIEPTAHRWPSPHEVCVRQARGPASDEASRPASSEGDGPSQEARARSTRATARMHPQRRSTRLRSRARREARIGRSSITLRRELSRRAAATSAGRARPRSRSGPRRRRARRRGRDFDLVLLGIPVGAIPFVAPELARVPQWKRSLEGEGDARPMRTTPTLGVQLWLTETAAELGWVIPEWAIDAEKEWGKPLGLSTLLGGYTQPLDTIADMSHLLPVEDWPPATSPRACSTSPAPTRRCPASTA
ncbi:MAG: hypothetical protein M5U28_33495 [Sandaracinaceae bacterium]|nr:hypothetical protein [Sandaracinaceae bacterium]